MLFPAVFLRPMKSASMDSCNDPWSLLNNRQNIIQIVWINATCKFSKLHDLEILIMRKIHKQQQANIESYFVLINYLLR